MKSDTSILGRRAAEYERLRKRLNKVDLLAQGSVFELPPPEEAPRAKTRYMWTRKVKGKTVTKALNREQYRLMKKAIKANRQLEDTLTRMREIVQEGIVQTFI